jgi:hypothetical protein
MSIKKRKINYRFPLYPTLFGKGNEKITTTSSI